MIPTYFLASPAMLTGLCCFGGGAICLGVTVPVMGPPNSPQLICACHDVPVHVWVCGVKNGEEEMNECS